MFSIENLRRRAEILRNIRRFFDHRHFVEVQTPMLSADTVIDLHVEPISVTDSSFPLTPHGDKTFYLRTSPEFSMKRLLAAGMEAIYEIGTVFRKGDRGQFHNVEFTMLEWYRAGDDYCTGMNFLAELVQTIGSSLPDKLPDELPDELPKIEQRSFETVFQQFVGVNPHQATAAELQCVADAKRIAYPPSFSTTSSTTISTVSSTTEDWIDLLFSELVQPNLHAVIVYDYPVSQSQLAQERTVAKGYAVSERFELFLYGIEIANGYHELLDAEELRCRFRKTLRQRLAANLPPLPIESRLLAAMESGLPPSSGTALGIDRLLMALLHADSIDNVLAFPIELS